MAGARTPTVTIIADRPAEGTGDATDLRAAETARAGDASAHVRRR